MINRFPARSPDTGSNTAPPPRRRLDDLPADADNRAVALLAYWHEAAERTGLPDRSDFDALKLWPWLGFCSIYEYEADREDFRNRLEGCEIISLIEEDWTGHYASDVDRHFGSSFRADLIECQRLRRPLIDQIHVFQKSYKQVFRLLLPIAAGSSSDVDQIFLAMFVDGGRRTAPY